MLYVAVAFVIVPGILIFFHGLSRRPDLPDRRQQPPSGAARVPESLADEAEQWLRAQP